MLPPDVLGDLQTHRSSIVEHLSVLPIQLVHGDLIPGNVLASRSDHAVAFIDLDHLPLAPRVWDIGKYLARRLRQPSPAEALPHVAGFVGGYHQISPLSEGELDAIPLAALAMNVFEADWVRRIMVGKLERRLLPGHEEDLRVTLDTIRWQLHDPTAVAEAVRSGIDRSRDHHPPNKRP